MNKGLFVNGEKIEFRRYSIGEISYTCITKSFKINFDDVKLVVVSPRLALDDEMLMITLIDKDLNFYQFSSNELLKASMFVFEKKLNISSIREIEWEKFSYEDHENSLTDKIIYPKEMYWENLFEMPKGLKKIGIRILKFFLIKKSISGKLSPKVIDYVINTN